MGCIVYGLYILAIFLSEKPTNPRLFFNGLQAGPMFVIQLANNYGLQSAMVFPSFRATFISTIPATFYFDIHNKDFALIKLNCN